MTTPFVFSPDYQDAVNVKYRLSTMIYTSYDFIEQRLAKSDSPKIEQTFTILEPTTSVSSVRLSDEFYFPIYVASVSGTKTSSTKINTYTPLYFWDNAVYLMDTVGNVGTIQSIAGTEITLTSAWTGNISGVYYPAFKGHVTACQKELVWNNLVKMTLTVEEA